jgi:large subunit ribosomal protein L24
MQTRRLTTKPNKQRKMIYTAPDHVRHRLLAARLAPELRTSQETRALPVRSGDTVRLMRGDRKGFEGKITRVDRSKYRVYVEGLTREKVDGTAILIPVHPSKVMLTRLNLNDKWRKKILEKKKTAHKKLREIKKKPETKPDEKLPEVAEIEGVTKEKVDLKEKLTKKRSGRRRKPAKKPAEAKAKIKAEEIKMKRARARKKKAVPKKKEKEGNNLG